MSEWVDWVPVTLLTLPILAVAVIALAVVLLRERARHRAQLAAVHARLTTTEERVAALESARSQPAPTPPAESVAMAGTAGTAEPEDRAAYVITRVADPHPSEPDRRIDGSLFADLVLRESMVKAVSLAYGLGRALSPESRNRIRFLMRQEVKRSRKQRRSDLRAARRHLADLQRAGEDAA